MAKILTGDNILLYLSKQPIKIPACNIFLTQPTIKEIALTGEESFLTAVQILSNMDKVIAPIKEGNSELALYDDFLIFLAILSQDKTVEKSIYNFLNLVFPNYDYNITDNEIQFMERGSESVIGIITPYTFPDFQKIVSNLFGITGAEEEEKMYNPANEKAKEIMDKIMQGRKKRQESKSKEVGSLYGGYISALSIGLGIDINIILDYTPFQLQDSFLRYMMKQSSDYYRRIASMPLLDVSKIDEPEEWTSNLYKERKAKNKK